MSSSSSPGKPARPTLTVPPSLSRPSSPLRSPSFAHTPPLHLTVRFSTSLPDLHLDILTPQQTTIAALKSLIRSRLASPNRSRRLRFIHGGRVLPDGAVLSSVLRAPPPPPRDASRDRDASKSRGKGKGVEGRDATRVYVNCSIGDVLTDKEIEDEDRAAATPSPAATPGISTPTTTGPVPGGRPGTGTGQDTTSPRPPPTPRGFDRLLQAGFTPAEVNQLRLQFRSIQAARHTPDTMPDPDTLRGMEDAWIDNNNGGPGAAMGGGGGGQGGGGGAGWGDEEGVGGDEMGAGVAGLLDTLVKGMFVGFMFPLGSVGWLIREEGLWSRRWQVFASFGFLFSFFIGLIRALSGDSK
ncbi:hypothetical protein CONLIGDRAFT_704941 [Coniochaeta ligniaria NRRL 30616]|uniref:Ubiquitin-like domain-containing protein n=1 Tax=Coniochaeta ligniaria NRRL 30616 TaxID=1408157 RepID=A0A1J7JDD9_9PEZI|nr:hypothetical protein CONLIGDRAFT_704941 [Coniochaeta ligniaria NRRL 30616]